MTNRWSIKQTVAPTSEPLTAVDMAQHARISTNDEDTFMLKAIRAAREYAELVQWRAMFTSTWRLSMDYFPGWEIKVPMPPLQSVTSITYLDTAGTTQTLSSSLYIVATDSEPGIIVPAYGQIWPSVRVQPESVKVTYVAGNTAVGSIPSMTLIAIGAIAAEIYEHREMTAEQVVTANPVLQGMLEGNRIVDFSSPCGSSNNAPLWAMQWG